MLVMLTVFTRVLVAPKHKTRPNFCIGLLVSGRIENAVITRCTPTFDPQSWDKNVRLVHGWIRYIL